MGRGVSEQAGEASAEVAEAHARLLADDSIQFDLAPYRPPEVPTWLSGLGQFLNDYFWLLEIAFWVVVGIAALALAWVLYARFAGIDWRWRRRRDEEDAAEAWRPAEAPARALLGEADLLARQGRYADAAHLLLFRSIEEIEQRRPRLVRPALTSRDIAAAPELPSGPRSAFASIAMLVERSLFGGRPVDEDDWRQCRAAYEEFALAGSWR